VRKILAAALVAVSLLHQALVMAVDGHAVLHWQETAHQHDGGALYEDRSDESKRHLQSYEALDAELLIAAGTPHPVRPVAGLRTSPSDYPKPAPSLDGPARPPRLTA
jgi:hypothetical protein